MTSAREWQAKSPPGYVYLLFLLWFLRENSPKRDRLYDRLANPSLMLSRRSILECAALSLGAPMINRGRFSLFAEGGMDYSVRTVDLVRHSTVIDMLGLASSGKPIFCA